MYRYIISSFIAFVMVASFMMFWTPKAESGIMPDECVEAICACAGKFGGYMRNVPCNCFCECAPEPHRVCEPDRCFHKETPLVLQPYSGINDSLECELDSCFVECNPVEE
jgi:hypothetical protein